MNEEPKKKYRIGGFAIVILLILTLIADFVSIIPFLGDIFWVFMSYYLFKTGHGLLNMRNLAPTIMSFITESVPFLSSLPSIIAATIVIIIFSRIEDKTGLSVVPKNAVIKGAEKIPLYQDGKRLPRKV